MREYGLDSSSKVLASRPSHYTSGGFSPLKRDTGVSGESPATTGHFTSGKYSCRALPDVPRAEKPSLNGFHHREPLRREDSEELSDVSSGATSEDSLPACHRHKGGGGGANSAGRRTPNKRGDVLPCSSDSAPPLHSSPMLTGLLEGHVTRLATPPDPRHVSTDLADDNGFAGTSLQRLYRHRHHPRPPPAPRPRTIEGSELTPRCSRVYSPSRDTVVVRPRSRETSVDRTTRDLSCERSFKNSHHPHSHCHSAAAHPYPECWCEEEFDYDSCDERQHHHRHSYHEGLHHAHLYHQHAPPPPPSSFRDPRERSFLGRVSGGRSASPCCCHPHSSAGHNSGPFTALNDTCGVNINAITTPFRGKVGGVGVRHGSTPDEDYIPLWSCHSPLVR